MNVAAVLSAVAALLWPLVVLVLLIYLRGPIRRVISSAERREFTVKIGGQELTVGQLTQQQNDLVADLQQQVTRLRTELDATRALSRPAPHYDTPAWDSPLQQGGYPHPPVTRDVPTDADVLAESDEADIEEADTEDFVPDPLDPPQTAWPPIAPQQSAPRQQPDWAWPPVDRQSAGSGVLWVDDHPEDNALLIDQLQRARVVVDTARSTGEALVLLDRANYRAIITDMGRDEDGVPVPDAGTRLLTAVRSSGRGIPVVFYTSPGVVTQQQSGLISAGATAVITSPTELTAELSRVGLL